MPKVWRLRTQAVHTDDVGHAYRLAVVGDARGAFNLAAGGPTPPLDPDAGGRLRLGEFRTGVGGGSGA